MVEVNAHHPLPYVFTDAAAAAVALLRGLGLSVRSAVNQLPAGQGPCLVFGASTAWLAGQAAQGRVLDARRLLLYQSEPVIDGATAEASEAAAPSPEAVARALWLEEAAHWLLAEAHAEQLPLWQALAQRQGSAGRALLFTLPPLPVLCWPQASPDGLPGEPVDVLIVGAIDARRQAVVDALQGRGLRVRVVCGAYGPALAPLLRGARLLLHVHHGQRRQLPVLRLLQPVAQGLPVLCEDCDGDAAQVWRNGGGLAFAPYAGLVDQALALLGDAERRARLVRQALHTAAQLQAEAASALPQLQQALAAMPAPEAADLPAQIDAELRRSAEILPPPAEQRAPPVQLVQRQPGQGRWGRWGVLALLAFTLLSVWFTRPR